MPDTRPGREAILPKIEKLTTWLNRSHIPETVTIIVCAGLAVVGGSLIASPDQYTARATFAVALGAGGWASPAVWGWALLLPTAATVGALATGRRDVFWPLLAVVAWVTAWSYALALSDISNPDAVSSATIVYSTLSFLLATLAAMYIKEGGKR